MGQPEKTLAATSSGASGRKQSHLWITQYTDKDALKPDSREYIFKPYPFLTLKMCFSFGSFPGISILLFVVKLSELSPDSQADEQLELSLFANVSWWGINCIDIVAEWVRSWSMQVTHLISRVHEHYCLLWERVDDMDIR